jgi:uncharacterized repeat protein (TIGR02543 family)/LPXTG-motif cell wall-anchored protein
MIKRFSSVFAATIAVIAATVFPGAAAIASAVDGVSVISGGPAHEIHFDCVAANYQGGYPFYVVYGKPGETMTLTLSNCDGAVADAWKPYWLGDYYANLDSGGMAFGGVDYDTTARGVSLNGVTSIDVDQNTDVYIYQDGVVSMDIEFYPAPVIDDPSGSMIYTDTATFTADNPNYVVPETGMYSRHDLNGDPSCRVQFWEHQYATLPITITESGDYTFRYVDSLPTSNAIFYDPAFRYFDDPFMAVYTTFDPNNPDDNVLGCNDDYRAMDDEEAWVYTSHDGYLMSNLWPQFSSHLEPGTYDIVVSLYTTNRYISADELESTRTGYFQMWGPPSGFVPPEAAVDFDTLGGDDLSGLTISLDQALELPVPTRSGFTFVGWFTDPEGGLEVGSGDYLRSREGITLYARWSDNPSSSTGGEELAETGSNQAKTVILAILAISASIGIIIFRRRARLAESH